ncbi:MULTISPECIES: FAD-binding oxidoreductase [unclassified Pseudomonas]|uniref:NAD(P)/FAD-dependent oxidoreductase n=1 Tax=unclassified Pseudomonas TaxID=196821 RepID=UPI00073067F4|nr:MULTISPECIES: FAD-binding oxidoreductase [unclassified Pseudomonas]KSW25142.1 FAD-dependent oxidoreductase [Pseudomonas sp. ADP]OBP09419.1 FAD-dependent oxidoreductase [Pseudomonas sp. EGD-AKN5]QOF87718.1 FAD-binding oxidoreductase [Pseudomonas sp. ADPe]
MPTFTQTYYEATSAKPTYPTQTGRLDTRVCILGGGLAGLNTALGLAERGITDVALLESHYVGHGASGRNGGFVFGGYSLGNADLLATLGAEQARRLYHLTLEAVDLIRQRARQYAIDCDLVDQGVILANWFNDPSRLEKPRRLMKEAYGVDWEPITPGALREQLKTDRYFGGLLERNAFHFHPLKYVRGVARATADLGVRIHESSPALGIEKRDGRFVVRTAGGEVHAEQVVFCGGGYARGLYRPIERAVLPIATYVIATEPLGERLQDAIACQAAVYDTRFAFDYYRPLADGRILWGGRISILDRGPEAIAALLKRDLTLVYPQLAEVKVDYAWGGLMSYGRHQMAQIGQDEAGIWHAIGFGGHGMAPTTVAGEVLADAISGAGAVPPGFARFGLTHAFGLAGLLAAQATYSAYEARDAFDSRRLNG